MRSSLARELIPKDFRSVSITCRFEPELSSHQAKLLSQKVRTRDVLAELGVSEILLVDPAEDGHIELKLSDGSELVIHPRYDFRVNASDVSQEELSGLEGHLIVLAKHVQQANKTASLRIRGTAHGFLEKDKRHMMARWFSAFEKAGEAGLGKGMRPRAMLLEVTSQVSLAVEPPDHVDLFIVARLPVGNLSKAFLTDMFAQGLRGLSQLLEGSKS